MPVVLSLIVLLVLSYCVVDVVMADAASVRYLPKGIWFVVVLVPLVGGIAWLVAGRPIAADRVPGGPGATGRPSPDHPAGRHHRSRGQTHPTDRRRNPRGPDDDPEFLDALQERIRREQGGSDGSDDRP